MKTRLIALSLSLLVFSACGGSDPHSVSTDPNAATGFITTNAFVPATAEISRDDGVPRDADGRPYTYPLLGQELPSFTGETVGGGRYSSDDISQWTVIDIWGLWCGDCMADAPFVAEVAARIARDDELGFISIHTPPNAARADEAYGKFASVDAYFNAKGYSYPTVLDTDASLRDLLQIGWTPSYLLVSPDGVVRGYRTDLSVAGVTPINDFFGDIAAVRAKHASISSPRKKASIGPNGANGLSGATRFTRASIEQAFPDYDVIAAQETKDEVTYPTFQIVDAEQPGRYLYTVWPNWDRGFVGLIASTHETVAGPNGAVIGETLFGELPDTQTQNCHVPTDAASDILVCSLGDDHQFQYVFEASGKDAGTALENADDAIKARTVLRELRYFPPTPETN